MTTATQQLPSNPARDFANAILAETNNGQDLFYLLHEIAQGGYRANKNDQITAATILTDRGLGKCPKQSPATPDPAPEHSANEPKDHSGPGSPRLVTQIDDTLNQSFGPPPSAHTEPAEEAHPHSPEPENPEPLEPFSIQTSIQEYILTITNNGQTLRTALRGIAFADSEDPTVTARHRTRATRFLIDRLAGTDLTPVHNAVCPECRRKWSTHPDSHDHNESHGKVSSARQVRYIDPEALVKVHAELKRMEDEGILTPDPDSPGSPITVPEIPEDFDVTPYLKEGAAKFEADIKLRLERQKQWPEIEERRRKKLAKIYPSHSEDDKTPDT